MAASRKSSAVHNAPCCPLDACLEILGGSWAPEILWYLRERPRRFGDLKRDLGAVSSKMLTARLRQLETQGVITRTVKPTSPPTVEYAVTGLGRMLQPVLRSIAEAGRALQSIKRRHRPASRIGPPGRPPARGL